MDVCCASYEAKHILSTRVLVGLLQAVIDVDFSCPRSFDHMADVDYRTISRIEAFIKSYVFFFG